MYLPRLQRALWVAACFGAIGSCSGGREHAGPPANQDDICAIFAERPGWRDAIFASARKWGAPAAVQMAILWRESGFRARARTRRTYFLGMVPTGHVSTAYGFAQAIDGTWAWYRRDTGNSGARRSRFADAADFVGWYMAKSATTNGIGMNDAYNQYLAYHEGHAGHRRGSWRAKTWLQHVAAKVAGRAVSYRGQLRGCS